MEFGWLEDVIRVKRRARPLVVLTHEEGRFILLRLEGTK
jgi:hypothetical protein